MANTHRHVYGLTLTQRRKKTKKGLEGRKGKSHRALKPSFSVSFSSEFALHVRRCQKKKKKKSAYCFA
jgi:hypothetical protein